MIKNKFILIVLKYIFINCIEMYYYWISLKHFILNLKNIYVWNIIKKNAYWIPLKNKLFECYWNIIFELYWNISFLIGFRLINIIMNFIKLLNF